MTAFTCPVVSGLKVEGVCELHSVQCANLDEEPILEWAYFFFNSWHFLELAKVLVWLVEDRICAYDLNMYNLARI